MVASHKARGADPSTFFHPYRISYLGLVTRRSGKNQHIWKLLSPPLNTEFENDFLLYARTVLQSYILATAAQSLKRSIV